jgi:predicted transcriptional regulator
MNTRLTIELPSATVAKLQMIAERHGQTVEEFIASCATEQTNPQGVRPDIAELFDQVLEEHSELYHRLA